MLLQIKIFLKWNWLYVLNIWRKFQRESFSPNTDNFLKFFIVLEKFSIWKGQWIIRKWNVMQNYVLVNFLWTFLYWLLYFANNWKKPHKFRQNCWLFKFCSQNTTASTETFTEKYSRRNFALHISSYLTIAFSKILANCKTIKKKTLKSC